MMKKKVEDLTTKQKSRLVWTNNEMINKNNLDLIKPCKKLGWCPYGELVEAFELRNPSDEKISCNLFGHDCPVFYMAEKDSSEYSGEKL